MKENVIIGRLIPAGKQYRKLHDKTIDSDNDYFDPDEDSIDISEKNLLKVIGEVEHVSDF
jgi:hypothetical protein